MVEIGVEDTVRMGAMGVARVTALDTPMFVVNPSP